MASRPHAEVLEILIEDLTPLHAAYMSFLCNGGLFISTTQDYELVDKVQLMLTLLDEPAASPTEG